MTGSGPRQEFFQSFGVKFRHFTTVFLWLFGLWDLAGGQTQSSEDRQITSSLQELQSPNKRECESFGAALLQAEGF